MRPRAGIVGWAKIADDPRIRRQGDALSSAGFDVIGFGLVGAKSPGPSWEVRTIDAAKVMAWHHSSRKRIEMGLRFLAGGLLPPSVEAMYWGWDVGFARLLHIAQAYRPDVWIGNDWITLPIVRRLAAEQGTPFVLDVHELATEEEAHRRLWRLLVRPFVSAIERSLKDAAAVFCVSQGIAQHLSELYGLKPAPFVVRNTPPYVATPFRSTNARIRVLYHGHIRPGRGLEETIASVALWRPEFTLALRGIGKLSYCDSLRRLAAQLGVADRVVFLPAVPMVDLVREASAFDIGIMILPGQTRHNIHALPNKVFEYAMAGLALVVSDLPEMRVLVDGARLGIVVEDLSAKAIAFAINSLDRQAIDAHKKASLLAARTLNWEIEAQGFVRVISDLLVGNGRNLADVRMNNTQS